MTEYWVSKKQYWCKYCNIWIRDDAPSRKQHETGLKHQGAKERFIRDLYKTGNQAKNEKIRADQEMARINAAAEAAYAKDVHLPSSRPMLSRMHPSAGASTSKAREASKPKDKWANYTSAKDLGLHEEASQSSYEVEQEIKGRAANEPGAWQTVVVPTEVYQESEEVSDGKRKLGEYINDDQAEGEDFKFAHKDKRPTRDPYDDDDWDPKVALGGLRVKSKSSATPDQPKKERVKTEEEMKREQEGALDREKWTGKLDLKPASSIATTENSQNGLVYVDGGWNKAERAGTDNAPSISHDELDVKPSIEQDVKPNLELSREDETASQGQAGSSAEHAVFGKDVKPDLVPEEPTSTTTNLFKKRRPPPSNRKK